MYFPVAGVEVSVWVPPTAAFAISLFTSMGGVSGAFLLLPFQMSVLGFGSPSASATNHFFNVMATPGGVWQYAREGRMLWPLTWVITIGTLPGVLIGALVRIHFLADPGNFKPFVGAVLIVLSASMWLNLLRHSRSRTSQSIAEDTFYWQRDRPLTSSAASGALAVRGFDVHRLHYQFGGQHLDLSVPRLMLLCLAVGVIGGIYGIGGGAFMAPLLVTSFGIPVYIAAGAALMATFVASAAGVGAYQLLAPFYPHMAVAPDWALGALFGIGGIAGMYCGARLQKFVPPALIKSILAIAILAPGAGYIYSSFRGAWR